MSLAELLQARSGRPGRPEEKAGSTAVSRANTGGRPGRPGSPGFREVNAKNRESEAELFIWPGGVRCIDCRHHRQTDHPHLVDCAAGVEPNNPTRLFWDTDRRGCETFAAIKDDSEVAP